MFFTIQAIDNDYGVDSDLEYNLTSSLTDTFELRDSVDCEGCQDVVNTKIIDREQLGDESVYYIDIVVTETEPCVPHEGVQCQEAATQCTLQILDTNDNSPVFSAASYTAQVKESATIGEIFVFSPEIIVTDADTDTRNNQALISFRNESFTEYFSVIPSSILAQGTLNIQSTQLNNAALDAELADTVQFTLVAVDKNDSSRTAEASFTINIIDVNDHAPVFEAAEYPVSILEDLSDVPSLELVRVVATDGDKSPGLGSPSLRYRILETGSGHLPGVSIDTTTGSITVDPDNNPFDAEVATEVVIIIMIKDSTMTPMMIIIPGRARGGGSGLRRGSVRANLPHRHGHRHHHRQQRQRQQAEVGGGVRVLLPEHRVFPKRCRVPPRSLRRRRRHRELLPGF